MNIRLASYIQPDSIVDGEGIRAVIWTQGCSHNCESCHNPSTHDFNAGISQSIEDIKADIDDLEGQDGITFSGGDPMFQAEVCIPIARYAKTKNLDIWCYTGFKFEDLLTLSKFKPEILEFLKEIDVLIDGKFNINERSLNLLFRGSKNQRIIDVAKSLKQNKVCTIDKYDYKEDIKPYLFGKTEYLYI